MSGINWSVLVDYKELFIRGFFTTLELTAMAICFGLCIGLLFGLMQVSQIRPLVYLSRIYIDLFRGTPLLLQLLAVHFAVLPSLSEAFGLGPPSAFVSSAVALSLNAGAYISEIFRGGINSIERGQIEAARSLGLSHSQAMRFIILPQAIKRMLPPLGNEVIALLKDTSLVTIIAVNDITYAAFTTAKNTFERWAPYILAAVMYLVVTIVLSRIVYLAEKRFQNNSPNKG